MKKCLIFLLCGCLLLGLAACGSDGTAKEPSKNPPNTADTGLPDTVTSLLVAAVKGEEPFTDLNGMPVKMADFKTDGQTPFVPTRYAAVDLDGNGYNDLMAEGRDSDTVLVLSYSQADKTINSYVQPKARFAKLKVDGRFLYKPTEKNRSLCRLAFQNRLTTTNAVVIEDGDAGVYQIDNKPVSPEDAAEAFEAWEKLEPVAWTTL